MSIDKQFFEFEWDYDRHDRRRHRRRKHTPHHTPKAETKEIVQGLADAPDILEQGFELTYQGARHEAVWIQAALGPFIAEGVIRDVLRLVKGGKEATVYQCLAGDGLGAEHVAAKVYRPRAFRNLRNDAQYRAGRRYLTADGKHLKDGRALAAMRKGTHVGKTFEHESWLAHEVRALRALHAAGVSVPEPVANKGNAIVMEWIGLESAAAPTLHGVDLDPVRARVAADRLLADVETMLSLGFVHADLSPFNVLMADDGPVIIDLPQVVSPLENRGALGLFKRDLRRLADYFRRHGVHLRPDRLAEAMWDRHVPADLWVYETVPDPEPEPEDDWNP